MISYPTQFDHVIFFFDLKRCSVRVQTLKIKLSLIKGLEVSSEMTQKIKFINMMIEYHSLLICTCKLTNQKVIYEQRSGAQCLLSKFIDKKCWWHYKRAQATSISRQAVAASECSSSRLGALPSLPPLSWVEMLHVTGGGFDT
jgi:hypothetical protein